MAHGYRELAGILREGIHRGDYPPGSTLPKQADLARDYAVNIKTVRNAVALLESEGLVTPVRRRGTVVRSRPPMRRLGMERYAKSNWKFGDRVAFVADRETNGQTWHRNDQTQTVERLTAPTHVADALQLEPGSEVYARARLVRHEGQPTHTLTSYYRAEDVAGTPLADPSPGPAGRGGGFAVLTLQGLEPDEITETLTARMPTPNESAVLEMPVGEPVMVLHRTTKTRGGRVVEYAEGIHAASRFAWTYTFTMPD
ncbi:GntR family transcriptional regulator [Oerskovia flava]|uniref:GntR family transcriptional regulator n=1 Tax=Oerskovia flava TaxID=2986422 RepID=UPI00223EA25C|nr:GntR family transcriptional regulator [Oerskovia sp. JB1-3-2]